MHPLAAGVLALSIFAPSTYVSENSVGRLSECDVSSIADGMCVDPSIDDGGVNVDGSQDQGGSEGTDPGGGWDEGWWPDDTDEWDEPAWLPPDPKIREEFENCMRRYAQFDLCFRESMPPEEDPEDAIPPITIHDVARFVPTGHTLTVEPAGIGIIGLPTNFVTDAATETVAGELFGVPLTVRFTPVSYLFDYGDDHTERTTTPGIRWEDENLPQFTATETSHVYKTRGEYDTAVTITYTAELNLGSGWTEIPGSLDATATQSIRVYKVTKALVQHTCIENPAGPSC